MNFTPPFQILILCIPTDIRTLMLTIVTWMKPRVCVALIGCHGETTESGHNTNVSIRKLLPSQSARPWKLCKWIIVLYRVCLCFIWCTFNLPEIVPSQTWLGSQRPATEVPSFLWLVGGKKRPYKRKLSIIYFCKTKPKKKPSAQEQQWKQWSCPRKKLLQSLWQWMDTNPCAHLVF